MTGRLPNGNVCFKWQVASGEWRGAWGKGEKQRSRMKSEVKKNFSLPNEG